MLNKNLRLTSELLGRNNLNNFYELTQEKFNKNLYPNNIVDTVLKPKSIDYDEYQSFAIESLIDKVFSILGIRRNLVGAMYLCYAIKIAIANPFVITSAVTTRMYPCIAKYFDTNTARIERAIRNTLEDCFTFGKFPRLNALFGMEIFSTQDKPTNAEFIALIADKINLKLQSNRLFNTDNQLNNEW